MLQYYYYDKICCNINYEKNVKYLKTHNKVIPRTLRGAHGQKGTAYEICTNIATLMGSLSETPLLSLIIRYIMHDVVITIIIQTEGKLIPILINYS